MRKNPFHNTRKALIIYRESNFSRNMAWQDAKNDHEIRRAKQVDLEALNRVRIAFHEDTQDYNSFDNCMLASLDFMETCVKEGDIKQ